MFSKTLLYAIFCILGCLLKETSSYLLFRSMSLRKYYSASRASNVAPKMNFKLKCESDSKSDKNDEIESEVDNENDMQTIPDVANLNVNQTVTEDPLQEAIKLAEVELQKQLNVRVHSKLKLAPFSQKFNSFYIKQGLEVTLRSERLLLSNLRNKVSESGKGGYFIVQAQVNEFLVIFS